jgi:hypothetical protein
MLVNKGRKTPSIIDYLTFPPMDKKFKSVEIVLAKTQSNSLIWLVGAKNSIITLEKN